MATNVGTEKDLTEMVKNLIGLDYDAISAYESAIDRLEDATNKQRLTEFMADHQRHTQNLGEHLQAMGETPPQEGSMKSYLTQGKVIIGGLMGDDAILKAMKTNEDDTNTAYEQALQHTDLPEDLRKTLEENFADERTHRAWIEEHMS